MCYSYPCCLRAGKLNAQEAGSIPLFPTKHRTGSSVRGAKMARSKLRWPRLVLLALAAVGLHSLNVQGTPTLDSVVETWKARQDRTRSARFTWHGTLTTAGAMELGKRPAKDRKAIAHLPDKTVKHDCSLSLDGDMLRYERNGPEWVAEFSDYAAYPYIAVFDGEVGKSFYGAGRRRKVLFPERDSSRRKRSIRIPQTHRSCRYFSRTARSPEPRPLPARKVFSGCGQRYDQWPAVPVGRGAGVEVRNH